MRKYEEVFVRFQLLVDLLRVVFLFFLCLPKLTIKVWEKVLHRREWQLFLKPINLVQEQDDGCLDEPFRVTDGLEQCQGFLHPVHVLVLQQQLIVFGYRHQKNDGRYMFEIPYPFTSF